MKGMTHFIVGAAIATCFASALELAYIDKSLIILLGGMFGVLPDTLDFRFARYMMIRDYEVTLDPDNLDPMLVAKTLAKAIDQAQEENREVRAQFHTIKLGPDEWRRYSIKIDPERKVAICKIGPIISTGQQPYPETEIPEDQAYAEAPFHADLDYSYHEWNNADIFSGPDFAFIPEGDMIRADFIPWHRMWSHSLSVGLLLAPLGFVFYALYGLWTGQGAGYYIFETKHGLLASAIIIGGFWGHVLTDQTGNLGSNLWHPFTKKRSNGTGWTESGGAVCNTFTNYGAVALMIWNMNAFSYEPVFTPWLCRALDLSHGTLAWYFAGLLNFFSIYAFLPLGVIYIVVLMFRRVDAQREELKETGFEPEEIDQPFSGGMGMDDVGGGADMDF